jgi:hypothetical protein
MTRPARPLTRSSILASAASAKRPLLLLEPDCQEREVACEGGLSHRHDDFYDCVRTITFLLRFALEIVGPVAALLLVIMVGAP